jgi:hypothetical protein
MSIHDERDLRGQLGAALDDFAPGPIPIQSVVRQGRAVVIRRRVTAVAAGVALLVAAAVGGPAVFRALNGISAPASGTRYHVTLDPPGPGSPKGLIASGRIGGRHWLLMGRYTHRLGTCFAVWVRQAMDCTGGLPPRAYRGGGPVSIDGADGKSPQLDYGTVRSDVTLVRVSLSNGQVLALHPEPVFGPGYAANVGFPVPRTADVRQITAYSSKGELAYAIPFTVAGSVQIVRWLRPGQPALPRPHRYLLGSGTVAEARWTQYLYVGPWGSCVGNAGGGSFCFNADPGQLRRGKDARQVSAAFVDDTTGYVVIAVAPSVSHLRVRMAGGRTFRVSPVSVGGGRFCTFSLVHDNATVRWIAYSAAGTELASGSIS